MTTRVLAVCFLALLIGGCGESTETVEQTPILDESSANPLADEAADPKLLDTLAKPAVPPTDLNRLNDYLIEIVETIMVKGSDAVATNDITRRLLDLLEEEQLTPFGRPEGVVRDKVIRIKEDMDSYRPPRSLGKELTERQKTNLRLLGKLYADDLRNKLSPKGAGGKAHEGFLRQVPAIPEGRLKAGHEALTWKRIGGFIFDKEKKILPEEILALNQKKVAISGFLMPVAEFDQMHEFLLVDSLWTCCFGEPAAVNQVIIVKIPRDEPGVPYYRDPILVHGLLDVGVEESEGWVTSVYRMTAGSIETISLK